MSEPLSIQWFPGHMAKTRRLITESLPLIDGVAEIIDARIPVSSRNPELDSIIKDKPRLILMNKADIADAGLNKRWISYFAQRGIAAMPVDCKTGKGLSGFPSKVNAIMGDRLRKFREKGMSGRTLRIMVVGIPNVGKSSFINRMAKNNKAKVADRPGVTRGNQWFQIGGGVELMDTAGVLWPKFDDPVVGERLAFTGAIKDAVTDVELLAIRLLELMNSDYSANLEERYKVMLNSQMSGVQILEAIGRKRGMLISGGEIDTKRASVMVLDEFRAGKLGRITLEIPEE